jgi:hypothetical protein
MIAMFIVFTIGGQNFERHGRGAASLLVPVAAGPAVQSRTHNPARSHD